MYTGLTLSIAIAAYYKAETAAKEIFYYIAVISGIIGIIRTCVIGKERM